MEFITRNAGETSRNSENRNPNLSVSKSAPPKNPNNPVIFSAWREIWQKQSKSVRAKKKPKATSQKPFKLRTEERGKLKEEELLKKMQELVITEEKQRIPIAQGLPWTTYEPDRLVKPPVKEITRPLDLKLHSDLRAIDRAEFEQIAAEKMKLREEYKMERGKQQKLAEDEEIKRLRKEMIPKAQNMPYFDNPFVPSKSLKRPTIARQPNFHTPQAQRKKMKRCLSCSDITNYTYPS